MRHESRRSSETNPPTDGSGHCPPGAWFARGPFADRQFCAVVLVWALCWLSQIVFIHSYGTPLPWADDWELTSTASGKVPLTWDWLWVAANEHRAPLTRLMLFVVGEMASWNWQAIHYTNLTFLALGCFTLLWAAQAMRGRSELSDAFLCLLVLTPYHYETLVLYGYAYGMAGGWMCLAIGLAAIRWPWRSPGHLGLYFMALLAVIFSAGPAGSFWAVGLCGVVVLGLFARPSGAWKACAVAGTATILATAATMLLTMPRPAQHAQYFSDSVRTAFIASARISVCWMGQPPLKVLWPWALVPLMIPAAFLMRRLSLDVASFFGKRPGRTEGLPAWWGLAAVLLGALLVVAAMGYGRGRFPNLWDSRYVVLTMPVGIATYLLMVQTGAPRAIPQFWALGMAMCVGWCWPEAIAPVKWHHESAASLTKTLRRGKIPLSALTREHSQAVGFPFARIGDLQDFIRQMRESELSIFRDVHRRKRRGDLAPPRAWEAEVGTLGSGLQVVEDERATGHRAVEAVAEQRGPATATYEVDIKSGGTYELWCRVRVPAAGPALTVAIDDRTPLTRPVPSGPEFLPFTVDTPFDLAPGKHKITFILPSSGMRLDLLELIARPRPRG